MRVRGDDLNFSETLPWWYQPTADQCWTCSRRTSVPKASSVSQSSKTGRYWATASGTGEWQHTEAHGLTVFGAFSSSAWNSKASPPWRARRTCVYMLLCWSHGRRAGASDGVVHVQTGLQPPLAALAARVSQSRQLLLLLPAGLHRLCLRRWVSELLFAS